MLANSRNRDITSSGENINTDDEFPNDEYDTNRFNETSSKSPLEIDECDSGANDFSDRSAAVHNDVDRVSHPAEEWTSPFTVKKSWSYRAVLNEGSHTRLKISAHNKPKKSKTRKPHSLPARQKQFSSPHDNNILTTRLKGGTGSSRKMLPSKPRKKLTVALIKNQVNGLDKRPIVDEHVAAHHLVPNQTHTDTENEVAALLQNKFDDHGDGEYAQYLELKPSVKFKCCRCGTNDFSSMVSLQQHMASCEGRTTASVTANPLPELSTSAHDPQYAPVARNLKIKRQVLLCSSCGTYYQHYNLYIHMRETHNKQICLFCRNTFSKPEQLWQHLVATHKLNSVAYSSAAQVRDAFKSFYITCCTCNVVFSDEDRFGEHKCEIVERPPADIYCSGCRLHNEPAVGDPSHNEPAVGDRSIKTEVHEDELHTPSSEDDAGECEPVSPESTLDVIGVSDQHTVTSLTDEVDSSEVAAALEVNVEDTVGVPDPASEPIESPEPTEESKPAVDNPCLNLSEDSRDAVENDLRMSTDDNDCDESENQPPVEIANPPKPEPAVSCWLPSEDETETPDVVAPVASSSAKEDEVFPQPLTMALMLDDTVASLSVPALIKECVRTSCLSCLYCNNSTVITIDGSQLASHLRSEHRYMPTKHEDDSQQVMQKIEQGIADLRGVYMSVSSLTLTQFDGTFACLQCSFSTPVFKDLCHHKRKSHHKVIFPCIMCKCSFMHYSQLLCHLCPGVYASDSQNALHYHCCFCDRDRIPSAFRLMVHLRKFHQACDICLARHRDQSELFSHMIKQHKMNHLCYKCNFAYRSRDGINEHLFWKHGTESVLCKRCLQKKWPHAYHFCVPASTYACDECSRIFSRATALTVHRRAHTGDFPFACTECDRRFISKRLLAVHNRDVHNIVPTTTEASPSAETTPADPPNANENGVDDGKKRRKKKRKKLKTDVEKPLLDELPPLNLSSESEEDSAEEEVAKPPPVEPPPTVTPPPSPKEEPAVCPVYNFFPPLGTTGENGQPDMPDVPAPSPTEPQANETVDEPNHPLHEAQPVEPEVQPVEPEAQPVESEAQPVEPEAQPVGPEPQLEPKENPLERIRNCLVIEHSYCIPDSIFRSEGLADASHSAAETSLEGGKLASPRTCSKGRDKSCSKSVTPRKRKRGGSSSSDSSSDSDSSSSSCGSNCSCNEKSNSNCSSSSSGSDYSTTPDKKRKKKKSKTMEERVDTTATNDEEEEARREQTALLETRESDLDTDISTSDEDFYDAYPYVVPSAVAKPEPEPEAAPVPAASPSPGRVKTSRERKNRRQQRRAPKITINLGAEPAANRVIMNSSAASTTFSISLSRVESQPALSPQPLLHSYTPMVTNEGGRPGIHLSKMTPTAAPSNTPTYTIISGSRDSSGRRSKRERVKNRFYGYSSSDEASGQDASFTATLGAVPPVKRRPPKRPPKPRPPGFVGIRAKKPLIMPSKRTHSISGAAAATNTMASTHPSMPPHLYRMPSYIRQQQQQQQLAQQQKFGQSCEKSPSSSSSSDSDSDNLVINEPLMVTANSQQRYKVRPYPAEAMNVNSWQRSTMPQPQQYQAPAASGGQNNDVPVYCYCKCPYDEVSEMIGCDAEDCEIEWFHFECVGIMSAPQGEWYCKDCLKKREALSRSFQ